MACDQRGAMTTRDGCGCGCGCGCGVWGGKGVGGGWVHVVQECKMKQGNADTSSAGSRKIQFICNPNIHNQHSGSIGLDEEIAHPKKSLILVSFRETHEISTKRRPLRKSN